MLRIALINAPLQSDVCDQGVGHQMPLGLLMIGGPLLDVGHQVLATRHLSAAQLFIAVKLIELIYHLHPRRVWRMLAVRDPLLRQQLRFAFRHTGGVYLAEIAEFLSDRRHTRGPHELPISAAHSIPAHQHA